MLLTHICVIRPQCVSTSVIAKLGSGMGHTSQFFHAAQPWYYATWGQVLLMQDQLSGSSWDQLGFWCLHFANIVPAKSNNIVSDGFESCIQQRKTTCLLLIRISLACARASKLTTTNMYVCMCVCMYVCIYILYIYIYGSVEVEMASIKEMLKELIQSKKDKQVLYSKFHRCNSSVVIIVQTHDHINRDCVIH